MADSAADRLAVLHGLRLKGFAEADVVGALTGVAAGALWVRRWLRP